MESGESSCQAAVVLSERGDTRVVAAVDDVGAITLIGCPAQLTRDALTTVCQEVLVFTGRLWRMAPQEFSSVIEKRLGQSLDDYFSSRIPIGWSEKGFLSGLGRSLEHGRFPVVLLVTDSSPEVEQAVAHLRTFNLAVKPLGVELYESSGVEIMMPRVLELLESGPQEEREPVRPASRPVPSQPRTPPRPQPSTAGPEVTESEPQAGPAQDTPPWSEEPVLSDKEAEPAYVDQEVEAGEPALTPLSEPAVVRKPPWANEPPSARDVIPPPVQSRPVSAAPPPAPKPAATRPGWDGAMPGVMAGRRPTRRPPEGSGTPKGHEQASGRR